MVIDCHDTIIYVHFEADLVEKSLKEISKENRWEIPAEEQGRECVSNVSKYKRRDLENDWQE